MAVLEVLESIDIVVPRFGNALEVAVGPSNCCFCWLETTTVDHGGNLGSDAKSSACCVVVGNTSTLDVVL